ncbi:MAG: hypothetical protein ABSA50_11310 [Candidatus Bathyarchaeia archaeon]
MVSRRIYEFLGFACGFVLIDYGFSFVAGGFPGARQLTSQFLGANLIAGGSVAVFASLYYLLRPVSVAPPIAPSTLTRPDVGVETIVEEETPPKSSFYRNIEYIGYSFTVLGLFSAADLVLQVFIRSTYNEARWWVEILLVTFGVLSYTIFGSIGRLGSQEEAKLSVPLAQPKLYQENVTPLVKVPTASNPTLPESLEMQVGDFTRSSSGEYERHLSDEIYDMFRMEREGVTAWREDRKGMRSVYLAGPYELSRKLLEGNVKNGVDVRIGILHLSVDSMRELLALLASSAESVPSASS